jgi:hypothetical protein
MVTLHERMNRLAKAVPLSKEQQIALAQASGTGDVKASQLLVESNLRLIIKFATHYYRMSKRHNKNVDLEEFVNAGCLGLLKSLKTFDATKGASVMWHAQSSIKGQMLGLMSQDDLMRVDLIRNRNKKARKSGKPTISEPITVYIDDVPTDRSEKPKPEFAVVEVDPEQDRRLDVERALRYLNDEEIDVITKYFGLGGIEPMPSYEVRISRTYTTAMKKLGYGIGAMVKPVPLKADNPNRQPKSNRENGRRINGVLSCQMTKPDSANETHTED